jgi:hypothetical protein
MSEDLQFGGSREKFEFSRSDSVKSLFLAYILGEKFLKSKRDLLAAGVLAILLVSLVAPIIALPSLASDGTKDDELKVIPESNWYRLESDIVTVLFPREGQKPMFIWWYTGKPDQVYVVKYQGLIEYFGFGNASLLSKPEYYNRLREAWADKFEELCLEPEEHNLMGMGQRGMMRLMILQEIMAQINETWHSPYFPFNAARWSLSEIKNVTTDGKTIGVSFAFTLEQVPEGMPGFKFAEKNIMIRVRFYNTTVEEKDPDTGYTFPVDKGEMKIDLVVNKWQWNIDSVQALIDYLKAHNITVTVPEAKTRLALWVNLASINITRLLEAEQEPEQVEEHSTATHMDVEQVHEDIRPNMTLTSQEKPIEIDQPVIKLRFANETTTLGGFFRFVSQAKVKNYPKLGDVGMVPVKAAYIAAGAYMRLFIGYPYFGNGTLEHDPSIGVEGSNIPSVEKTPQYTVQTPTGIDQVSPMVVSRYQLPLFTMELTAVLVSAVSIIAVLIYVAKWKRKTPINMVGAPN